LCSEGDDGSGIEIKTFHATVFTSFGLVVFPAVAKSLEETGIMNSEGLPVDRLTSLAIAGILGFATDPLVEAVFNRSEVERDTDVEFRDTLLFGAADSIALGARAAGLLLLLDWLGSFVDLEKYLPFLQVDLAQAAPQVGLTIWLGLSLSTIKRTIFKQAVWSTTGNLGRVALFDRLIDFVLGIATTGFVLHELQLDFTAGIQSLFAASGVSALVFSLASKGLATEIVGGFLIQAWDAFEVGDYIRLGDGTEGQVTRIGLMETEIIQNEIPMRIANSQLTSSGQRVSNLSRLTVSQVNQELRFKYTDLDKLPDLLEEIKHEIKKSCKKLIVDGSKPFRAVITGYKPDHVAVQVICHFTINPSSGEYIEMRQQVLLAIANAVKHSGVDFAIPAIAYETKGDFRPL
jgi:small-conductance mechanosensitive channel